MITLVIAFIVFFVIANKYLFKRISRQLKEFIKKKYNYDIELFTNYKPKRSRSLISLLYEYFSN